ncbi:type II CAAX endopeptidase family protein [Bacillus thuringiensis]|uniref:CPBP family intramembrane glutamic endopeptidase n=1 Tax=Bacillus thuringiensis TaxID=1428 RepID=UPI00300DE1F0
MEKSFGINVTLGIIAGFFFYVLCSMHGFGSYVGEGIASGFSSNSYIGLFIRLGGFIFVVGSIIFVISLLNKLQYLTRKISFSQICCFKRISLKDISFIFALVILVFPIVNVLDEVGIYYFGDHTERFAQFGENMNFLLFVLSMAIIGPITEEIMVRGVFLHMLRSWHPVIAITVTSAVFSIIHLNPHQALYTIPSSVVYTFVAVITGSILAPIIAHILHNFITTLFLYGFLNLQMTSWYIVIPCTLIAIFLMYFMVRRKNGLQHWKGTKKSLVFPFTVLMIVTGLFVTDNLEPVLFLFAFLPCIILFLYKKIVVFKSENDVGTT